MAKDLAKQGYRVALLGRTMEKLRAVEEEIKADGGVALSVSADVADEAAVRRAQEIIEKELGVCSVLINGAGGNQSEALTNIPEYDERELLDDGTVKGFLQPEHGNLPKRDRHQHDGHGDSLLRVRPRDGQAKAGQHH